MEFKKQVEGIAGKWRFGGSFSKEMAIVSFGGYGNTERIVLHGLVVEKKGVVQCMESDKLSDNLRKMKCRFTSGPGRDVEVKARFQGCETRVRTDGLGYFVVEMRSGADGIVPCRGICDVDLELQSRSGKPVRAAPGRVFIPPASARFGVISDIDDTIIYTFATDRLRMIYTVLVGNARTRLPFAGVRAFYRALHDGYGGGEKNPFFYVSSSSWRIYDVMRDFIRLNELPPGPILMRAMEFTRSSLFDPCRHDHKKRRFREILDTHPDLPFLLIGDSGQRDAELYTELAKAYPRRIPALYLRDVAPSPKRREVIRQLAREAYPSGCELHLAETSIGTARHAASRGWINPGRLPEIERDWAGEEHENPVLSALSKLTRGVSRIVRSSRLSKR